MKTVYVWKKDGYELEATNLLQDCQVILGVKGLTALHIINRYDADKVDEADFAKATDTIFSEPPLDNVSAFLPHFDGECACFAYAALPGQFDQRSDSARQCLQLLRNSYEASVFYRRIVVLCGDLTTSDVTKIKRWLINPVDSHEVSPDAPGMSVGETPEPKPVLVLEGFIEASQDELEQLQKTMRLAMSKEDLIFVQERFAICEKRNPTETEIRVLDTYWSDHCRHTTFNTFLDKVEIAPVPAGLTPEEAKHYGKMRQMLEHSWNRYLNLRTTTLDASKQGKPPTLMEIATIAVKSLKKDGLMQKLDESDEINACTIRVDVKTAKGIEPWLVLFKNETHNHPTEIEPYGGAATCLGGAIRDPLSGRAYVYQAMRVTGASDPTGLIEDTLPGKLPQRKITTDAAHGYSSYGNQIGLATGYVREMYHPGYVAKRLEIGAVVGAVKASHVRREQPLPGDVVVLVGGKTGRDGIGGATGSSVSHSEKSTELSGAEVQKGNPVEERKLQRLFRRAEFSLLVKRCNDFGAGGVAVAIGELADGITINLDAVPKKYNGLNGTELAISESQERMAIVVAKEDVKLVLELANEENLEATEVAVITEEPVLKMTWQNQVVLQLERAFLDTNGASARAEAVLTLPDSPQSKPQTNVPSTSLVTVLKQELKELNNCSQKGLVSMFDSTIGASSVLSPLGGTYQLTPELGMAGLVPATAPTTTCTVMTAGMNPTVGAWSPYHGAQIAVTEAVARLVAMGGDVQQTWLTLQEYFPKLKSAKHWGLPVAAMLGALDAQVNLQIGAIGGKDSMSGTFNEYEVAPTLAAFALAPTDAKLVTSATFAQVGATVYLVKVPCDGYGNTDFKKWREMLIAVHSLYERQKVYEATAITQGSLLKTLTVSLFGNKLGLDILEDIDEAMLLTGTCGDLILVMDAEVTQPGLVLKKLGVLTNTGVIRQHNLHINVDELIAEWQSTLADVFALKPNHEDTRALEFPKLAKQQHRVLPIGILKDAKPVCVIPVFPGTNCELDMIRAMTEAGAKTHEVLIKNLDQEQLKSSLALLANELSKAHMLALPGGFSAGDEPDGSAKFILSVLSEQGVARAINEFVLRSDTLTIGICNGFQALLKSGLLPNGSLQLPQKGDAPTLAMNTIGKHLSQYVTTVVTSTNSPWLRLLEIGEHHVVPISHGEGRLVASDTELQSLAQNNQIAFRYVNPVTHGFGSDVLANPNGSAWAIEGLISPNGRILGKMAHTERVRTHIGKNIPALHKQNIFRAGVTWFTGETDKV